MENIGGMMTKKVRLHDRGAVFHERFIAPAGTPRKTGLFMLILVMILAIMPAFHEAGVHAQAAQEYQVKAAFIFNFAKFVEWPPEVLVDKQAPVVLCILGKDPFSDAFEPLKKRTVEGRRFAVRQVNSVQEVERCQMLYISTSEKDRLPQILKSVRNRHILTISDMKGFSREGGMITLVRDQEKIAMEINLDAARNADLKISSQLLKLATIIK
jgi:hypothetical protein